MSDWIDEFKEKLGTISREFQEAQQLLKDNGVDIYHPDIEMDKWEKIQIPRGHIRTVNKFRETYHLDRILNDEILIRNLAYSLQASDLMNLLFNRVNIGLSVGQVFYKMAIINHFSVIEGILFGVTKKLHSFCIVSGTACGHHRTCENYIKSAKKLKLKEIFEWFCDREIIKLSKKEVETLNEIKSLRDNIHIWLAENNEFLEGDYSLKTHNRTVLVLRKCRDELAKNLEEFEHHRNFNCKREKAQDP